MALKGRKPSTSDLRPITGRALQSVGDTLRPQAEGSCVLDLFAGSGRIGEKLLEEGAARAVFVERDKRRAAELRESVTKRWGVERTLVTSEEALHFLESTEERFDIVAADPPFPMMTEKFLVALFAACTRVARAEAILLVKHPARMLLSDLSPWRLWKEARFGDSGLRYFALSGGA